MKQVILLIALLSSVAVFAAGMETSKGDSPMNSQFNQLTPEEERVIVYKGTERPFTGKFTDFDGKGTYSCRRCNAALYHSEHKFHSGCGWPAFDDEIKGAIKRIPDADGHRTEIVCAACEGHLGHVFRGEGLTPKNIRHCVNSISIDFKPQETAAATTGKAILAGGCFWGVEHWLQQIPGVKSVVSGYIGGHTENPTYQDVCSHSSGHIEAVEVVFDPAQTDFETIARRFFEIHDPTQRNRQGPDIGEQYKSAVFYVNEEQKATTEKLLAELKTNGFDAVTDLIPATRFWPAENYHQDYYANKGSEPYCHSPVQRFK